MSKHEHPTILLGNMKAELAQSYPVRWCRECGTIFMIFGENTYEMIPEWVEKKVQGSKINYVPDDKRLKKPPQRVLGRGLRELMASPPVMNLPLLLGGSSETDD